MQSLFDIEKEEDLYAILNCVDTSSPEQIKTEYKRLALKYHPDKSSKDSKEFEKIKYAYDILGDPSRRAQYEKWKSSTLIIPFSDFIQLGSHAQTVHWQALPTQMTITESQQVDTDENHLTSIRTPAAQIPRVPIQTTGFWKQKNYMIQEKP